MLLKMVVLIGLALYFAIIQQWVFCVWTLICLIPRFGLGAAMALAITLLVSGFYVTGAILALLIAFNLIGNEMIKKARRSTYVDDSNVVINFVRYCREYLIVMRGLDENDAALAVLDPHLGEIMDKVKYEWVMHNLRENGVEDPDEYLLNFRFDSPKMEMINSALDGYSMIFNSRKPEIIDYLKSIGHPLGNR